MVPEPDVEIRRFQASDGYAFHYRRYAPRERPRGQIIALHGIQSHGGWYVSSSRELARQGYVVDYLDRRGSGLNFTQRGDVQHHDRWLADVREFHRTHAAPGVPCFISGISWGGKTAAAVAAELAFTGLVLLCPGFFPRVGPALGERLRIAVSRGLRPRRHFPIPLNDPALFTADPAWQRFLRVDPLTLRTATSRFLVESVRLDRCLRAVPPRIHCPVLLMLAGQDRIIDNAATEAWVRSFASRDIAVVQYPAAHHTLEFEPGSPFVADLVAWLHQHTS
jgi:alpha-beta hydrolase superfamily lysophospholipase